MLAAVVGTTLVGVVVALPAIRTRGTSLAIATLAIALMFNALIFTNSAVTGGVRGLPIDHVSFAGIDLDPLGHPQRYGAFVLVFLVIVGLLVANLRRGRGRCAPARRAQQRARRRVAWRQRHRGEGVCVRGRGRASPRSAACCCRCVNRTCSSRSTTCSVRCC